MGRDRLRAACRHGGGAERHTPRAAGRFPGPHERDPADGDGRLARRGIRGRKAPGTPPAWRKRSAGEDGPGAGRAAPRMIDPRGAAEEHQHLEHGSWRRVSRRLPPVHFLRCRFVLFGMGGAARPGRPLVDVPGRLRPPAPRGPFRACRPSAGTSCSGCIATEGTTLGAAAHPHIQADLSGPIVSVSLPTRMVATEPRRMRSGVPLPYPDLHRVMGP